MGPAGLDAKSEVDGLSAALLRIRAARQCEPSARVAGGTTCGAVDTPRPMDRDLHNIEERPARMPVPLSLSAGPQVSHAVHGESPAGGNQRGGAIVGD